MQLFGSTTSPYVRRLRMWLANDDFDLIPVDIFSTAGREVLKANNPTMKIPMLKDGEQIIYDSRVIYRYLNQKWNRETLSWDDENNMSLIDAANDSFIELLLLARSGVAMDSDLMFVKLQQERTRTLMALLNTKVNNGEFSQWLYPAICLYSLIDWIEFRQLFNLTGHDGFIQFSEQHQSLPAVIATDPRDN